jgi:hypothetical protein
MDRPYAHAHYKTSRADDSKNGFASLELYRTTHGSNQSVRVARVVFWDAVGDFFLETFNTEIPVQLAEDLIAEAKATIKVR